jgi:hypothetical protein
MGNSNNKLLTIKLYLDIFDQDSFQIITNFKKALEKTCFNPIDQNYLLLHIVFITKSNQPRYKFIINYLNMLQIISNEFSECFSCTINTFYRAYHFLRNIFEKSSELKTAKTSEDFNRIITSTFDYIDDEIIDRVSKDNLNKKMTNTDLVIYKMHTTEAPFAIINGVNAGDPKELTDEYWLNIFDMNFPDLKDCEYFPINNFIE